MRSDILKRGPAYRLFLWLRTRKMHEARLRTQLMKRGHSLDKALTEKRDERAFLFEVEQILKEMARRKIAPDDSFEWAWNLAFRARFGESRSAQSDGSACAAGEERDMADAIRRRRSVRSWTADAVDPAALKRAVDAAKWAPSSCNRQPWFFLQIAKPDDIDFISSFTPQPFLKSAPAVLVVLVDSSVYGENERHFAYLDAGAAIQNLLLALHAEGLGACWLGVKHRPDFADASHSFRARFSLPEQYEVVSFVAVGRASGVTSAPPRKHTDSILKVCG